MKTSRILKAMPAKQEAKNVVYNDILRTLFFGRMTQLELAASSRAALISDEAREAQLKVINALRAYDQKIRSMMDTHNSTWLTRELSSDKIYDINDMVTLAAQVEGEDYEDLMYMMAISLRYLVNAVEVGAKLDFKKYNAIFRMVQAEISRERNGIAPEICYDPKENTLTSNPIKNHNDNRAVSSKSRTAISVQ